MIAVLATVRKARVVRKLADYILWLGYEEGEDKFVRSKKERGKSQGVEKGKEEDRAQPRTEILNPHRSTSPILTNLIIPKRKDARE